MLLPRSAELLILSYEHPISKAQLDPVVNFHRQRAEKFIELDSSILDSKASIANLKRLTACKTILVQSSWEASNLWIANLKTLKQTLPAAKIVYLDWFAPLHIPQPQILEYCDLYLKKQIPSDISTLCQSDFDTNLERYECQWEPTLASGKVIDIDQSLVDQKLYLGWNFATDAKLASLLIKQNHSKSAKSIDLHCRIFSPPERDTWYTHMRGRAYDAITDLKNKLGSEYNLLSENQRIPFEQYLVELSSSKVCFSPFGYGEVCWRDFEAILCGSVLLKPDMSHIETTPDIYQPYKTYVPIKWDFSDLDEKFSWLMTHPDEMANIANNARQIWLNYLSTWESEWDKLQTKLNDSVQ